MSLEYKMTTKREFKSWEEVGQLLDNLLEIRHSFDKAEILEKLKLGETVAIMTDLDAVTTLTVTEE